MARKQIDNAELVPEWASLIGALAGCLRALNEPWQTAELMGITGQAFRCVLTEQDGVIAAGPAAVALDFRRALPLVQSCGRSVSVIESDTRAPEYQKRRAETLRQIRKSIDRGRPVVAYDLHIPEFGIIHGYDERAATLSVSSMISRQYGAALAEARWPAPERDSRLVALLLGDRVRVDRHRALIAALRFAVAYAKHGDPGDPTGSVHGLAAFAGWQAALAGGAPIDASGHARLIQMLQSARREAAAFLRDHAARQAAGSLALAEAAAAYERVALACSRLATLFPYPGGGAITDAGMRRAAAAALRQAEAEERAALGWVRAALVQLEPTR